jgi:hypothetical protein
MTRRTSTPARSRSRSSSAADGVAGSCSISRLALRNSFGSPSRRRRTTGPLSRHATYSSPTSRVDRPSGAIAAASCSQSARLARAIGTRYFIAAWATMRPCRTSSWTEEGSSFTSARRRDTQLALRSKRRASSSWSRPKLDCSSASSHPCSSADSDSAVRIDRLSSRASASSVDHTAALTVSSPSRRAARTRL